MTPWTLSTDHLLLIHPMLVPAFPELAQQTSQACLGAAGRQQEDIAESLSPTQPGHHGNTGEGSVQEPTCCSGCRGMSRLVPS